MVNWAYEQWEENLKTAIKKYEKELLEQCGSVCDVNFYKLASRKIFKDVKSNRYVNRFKIERILEHSSYGDIIFTRYRIDGNVYRVKDEYEKLTDEIILAEEEAELVNQNIIEVMNNKTEQTAAPSKPKGIRV